MLGIDTRLRRRGVWLTAVLAALAVALGCSPGTLINAPTCLGAGCTCEEDPSQPTCKGFNERPEGGTELPSEAGPDSAPDAEPDAPEVDAGDEAG